MRPREKVAKCLVIVDAKSKSLKIRFSVDQRAVQM